MGDRDEVSRLCSNNAARFLSDAQPVGAIPGLAPLSKQGLDLTSSPVHYLRRKMLPPVAADSDHNGLTSRTLSLCSGAGAVEAGLSTHEISPRLRKTSSPRSLPVAAR